MGCFQSTEPTPSIESLRLHATTHVDIDQLQAMVAVLTFGQNRNHERYIKLYRRTEPIIKVMKEKNISQIDNTLFRQDVVDISINTYNEVADLFPQILKKVLDDVKKQSKTPKVSITAADDPPPYHK